MKKIIISFLGLSLFLVAGCSRPEIAKNEQPAAMGTPQSQTNDQNQAAVETLTPKILNEVYDKIKQDYKIEGKISVSDGKAIISSASSTKSWWITGNGYNLMVNNDLGSIDVNYDSPKDLVDLAEKVFLDNGFKLNKANSSISKTDNSSIAEAGSNFNDYIRAYFKNNEFCLITAAVDVTPKEFKIGCFDNQSIIQAGNNQTIFLKGLKKDNKKVAIVSIQGFGSSVKVGLQGRATGYFAILHRSDAWKEIYSGQSDPKCSLMQQYNIPKGVYGTCIN